MSFTFEKFNSWSASQNYWRKELGINDNKIRCYPYYGLGHALVDLLQGLKHFWPTRKSVLVMPWGSPYLTESVQSFATEGYQVHTLSPLSKRTISSLEEAITKELMVTLLVRDHGVTGELELTEEELKVLNDKRISHIEIQHHWAWSKQSSVPHPFGAQIRIIDAQKVLVVLGPRFRMSPSSAQLMDWTELDWGPSLHEAKEQGRENKELIQKLEVELSLYSQHFKVFDFKNAKRLYNRLVFEVRGVDGSYFIEKLLAQLKLETLKAPGFESRCETTNLSRWDGIYPCWPWWGDARLTEAEQRSTVILSLPFVTQYITADVLNNIYLTCLKGIKQPANNLVKDHGAAP